MRAFFEEIMKLKITSLLVLLLNLAAFVSCKDSTQVKTYLNHALHYYKEQDFEKSMDSVKKSLILDSSNSEAQALLGRLLFLNKEFDQAQIQFEKACRLSKENQDYQWWLLKTYIINGSLEKAETLISNIQNQNSLDWRLFYWKAQLAKQKMDFETYFECLNSADILLQEGAMVYEELSLIWHRLNVAEKSTLYFGKAEVLKK